jgi:hypothetical protein
VISVATAVNFLDGGAADPFKLTPSMPANSINSMQYILMKHLYQVFASLLGCTKQGGTIFSNYKGNTSMAEMHNFIKIDSSNDYSH